VLKGEPPQNANSSPIFPLLTQRTYVRLASVLKIGFGFHRFSEVPGVSGLTISPGFHRFAEVPGIFEYHP
jgi:hypothetical protein